ncbi:hypothetical protein PRNP1_015335 [Phytophthora ramorum]
MRVGYVILATLATLLASANAEPATADSIEKKPFTITSPESNEKPNGVYVQSGGKKFLIRRVDDDSKQSDEAQTTQDSGDDDSSSDEDDSASDDQEERGWSFLKLKKFPKEYDTLKNKGLWYAGKILNTDKQPDFPKVPPRLRTPKLNVHG